MAKNSVASKLIFPNLEGIKGYSTSKRIYDKYQRAKKKNNEKEMVKLGSDLKPLLIMTLNQLKIYEDIYQKAYDGMKKDNGINILYTDEKITGFLGTLKELSTEIENIKEELDLEASKYVVVRSNKQEQQVRPSSQAQAIKQAEEMAICGYCNSQIKESKLNDHLATCPERKKPAEAKSEENSA